MRCLQDFDKVKYNLRTAKKSSVDVVHKFVFESEGNRSNRQRLRDFTGFTFDKNDEQYKQKCQYVTQNLSAADLVSICIFLNLKYDVADVKLHIFENLEENNLLKDFIEDDDNDEEEQDVIEDDVSNEGEEEFSTPGDRNAGVVADIHSNLDDERSVVTVVNQQVSPTGKVTQRFALNYRDVESTIRSFNGSGNIPVEIWVEDFEENAALMGWDQMQMLIFAKRSLEGRAKSFVRSERGLNTWLKLRRGLIAEFKRKVNSAKIHNKEV